MEDRENEARGARNVSSHAMVVDAAAAPVGRRDIAALVGALAGLGLAATGCASPAEGEFSEALASSSQALTGTSLRWVDTVLGAFAGATRTGDLATTNSANLGSAIMVFAKGCVTPGDGGGGLFYWDSTTTGDDGGTIIVPSVGGGRWKRVFGGAVNIMWFGAKSGSVTLTEALANAVALKNALESGYPVDGGGRTYSINGSCAPTSMVGLQNAKLVQVGSSTAGNSQTLKLVGLSYFFVDQVALVMGSTVVTLFGDDGNSALYIGGVNPATYVEHFTVTRVRVTGSGCGAGIQIRHAKRFVVEDCIVHDRTSDSSPAPDNDTQDGIEIVNCANFTLANCQVYNLRTMFQGAATVKWTRGFLLCEIRDCAIVGCNATMVDQGFDFSGAYDAVNGYTGNRRWTVSGCTANNCGTYGFKFANVTRDGLVTGCIASNTGSIGFVFSGSSASLAGNEKYNTQNIDVVGCKVVNVLGNGGAAGNATGFRLMQQGTSPTYPRSIRFKNCTVLDTQDTPTTLVAYDSDASLVEYSTSGYNTNIANTIAGCTATSNIATFAAGNLGPNICQVTGDDTHTLSGGTWTDIDWNTDIYDPTGLHNTSSNNTNIFIKVPGWYRLSAMVHFAPSATGQRQVRFLKNGAVINRSTAAGVGTSITDAVLVANIMSYANSGDSFRIQAYQDGNPSLPIKNNESHFSVELIGS